MGNENVSKSNRGGKREGAGRKSRAGIHSVVMRVPASMEELVQSFIDIYSDWIREEGDKFAPHKTNEMQRAFFRQTVSGMLEFERERLAKRNKEDSDKRQLRLFENETKSE
ncbi:hypothetical protein H6A30_13255 [Bacteroides caecigallinarum]|uniref:hypothetical protein n=1 Tax=Bacteroides caecigallinarum TaxID=1411144 RepID=UPI001957A646|nr:hypothetical protein [Bacteroides caecigallinarum]MBM6891202.1 hypothetical protein [Bacteroides caecigallinarum]